MTTGARRRGEDEGAGEAASLLLDEETATRLRAAARAAAAHAHSPYSGIRVGAAVLAGGEIHVGCNVENASSGLTLCAERVAIGHAVAQGRTTITALAVASEDAAGAVWPCGACCQVLAEFCGPDVPVWIEGAGVQTLGALFPHPFRRL